MTNQELLRTIQESIRSGEITKADLQNLIGAPDLGAGVTSAASVSAKRSATNSLVSKVLFGIGGLIAVVGVIILLGQNWEEIGFAGRIISTLGISLASYALAISSFRKEKNGESSAYFAVSAALAPAGFAVLLSEPWFLPGVTGSAAHMFVSGISLAVFASALWATRKSILHVISTAFATWFVYAFVSRMIQGSGFTFSFLKDIFVYTSMILALGYLSYGSWLKSKFGLMRLHKLYTFAAFALFLGSALFLSGVWNLLYAFVLVGAVALSINLRSTPALIVSALAIAVYLVKISAEYFSDSIGWALLLVLIGFLIIGLGYATYYLNKKYIHEETEGSK